MMRYKIAYFEQSLSKLFVRSVEKGNDGLFDCFIFWGVNFISMPCQIDLQAPIVVEEADLRNQPELQYLTKFSFVAEQFNHILAVSVQRGRARDFPESERIEVVEILESDDKTD